MKSEIEYKDDLPFPKLMICKDMSFIVLFSSQEEGSVVNTECNDHKIGNHLVNWRSKDFIPFNGKITLSN